MIVSIVGLAILFLIVYYWKQSDWKYVDTIARFIIIVFCSMWLAIVGEVIYLIFNFPNPIGWGVFFAWLISFVISIFIVRAVLNKLFPRKKGL